MQPRHASEVWPVTKGCKEQGNARKVVSGGSVLVPQISIIKMEFAYSSQQGREQDFKHRYFFFSILGEKYQNFRIGLLPLAGNNPLAFEVFADATTEVGFCLQLCPEPSLCSSRRG